MRHSPSPTLCAGSGNSALLCRSPGEWRGSLPPSIAGRLEIRTITDLCRGWARPALLNSSHAPLDDRNTIRMAACLEARIPSGAPTQLQLPTNTRPCGCRAFVCGQRRVHRPDNRHGALTPRDASGRALALALHRGIPLIRRVTSSVAPPPSFATDWTDTPHPHALLTSLRALSTMDPILLPSRHGASYRAGSPVRCAARQAARASGPGEAK